MDFGAAPCAPRGPMTFARNQVAQLAGPVGEANTVASPPSRPVVRSQRPQRRWIATMSEAESLPSGRTWSAIANQQPWREWRVQVLSLQPASVAAQEWDFLDLATAVAHGSFPQTIWLDCEGPSIDESEWEQFVSHYREARSSTIQTSREQTFIERELNDVRKAASRRSAYTTFERVARAAVEDATHLEAIIAYLMDAHAAHRDTFLGCLADLDFELPANPARRVASLLHSRDEELARSAALALAAGGEASAHELDHAMAALEEPRRQDLARLIRVFTR